MRRLGIGLSGLLVVFSLVTPPAAVAGQTALAHLTERLDQVRLIQAEFTQTKTLLALKRPLKTSGRLVFMRDKGVLWRIEKPYQASYLLGPDTVVEITPDGHRRVRPVQEVPALAQVGNVFQAIFRGNLQSLENHFNVRADANAATFQVVLDPKPPVARFLKRITARGGQFLDGIDIEETSGDRTRIEFTGTRLDTPLADTDREFF